jgi:Protein of unknown function (DUF1302)
MRTWVGRLSLALVVLCVSAPAGAYYLDKGRNFDVRMRSYTQAMILTQSNEIDSPEFDIGDVAGHRTFYNPEFDAKLTPYTRWMQNVPGLSVVSPDDFKFHFAWWGFYDGVYDYAAPVWNNSRKALRARFSQSDRVRRESYIFNDENKNPRHIYATRNRINELYLDFTKGPVFLRVGRQAISWGESDSVALLDVQNPFDLTQGAPAFFQDIEEGRIPLWTARATVKLIDSWGALSSTFADMYLVPGIIDANYGIDPITSGVSPYSAPVTDPQIAVANAFGGLGDQLLHVNVVQRLPKRRWGESRWGIRLTSLLFRDYTVQGWFFRTYPTTPIPLLTPSTLDNTGIPPTIIDDRGFRVDGCFDANGNQIANTLGMSGRTRAGRACGSRKPVVNQTVRRLESVFGLAATWYSAMLNSIVRTEAEYFLNEDAFIPHLNVNAEAQNIAIPIADRPVNRIPKANFLRGLLGFDRFFFARWLNPTRSILFSLNYNIQWNTSESGRKDFRYPNPKPGKPVSTPDGFAVPDSNFEDLYAVEQFFIWVLQTDYFHGRLEPRITIITDVSGIFAFAPVLTYRVTDNFLVSAAYKGIEASRRAGLATFRDRDQVQLRVTMQLN